MSQTPSIENITGNWTYQIFPSNPGVFNPLGFGPATIKIGEAPTGVLRGSIDGPGWSLELSGSISYGEPCSLRFQGKGVAAGEECFYDYLGYAIKPRPNGVNQVPALAGSVTRMIPHANGSGGASLAGVVGLWIAVWQGPIS